MLKGEKRLGLIGFFIDLWRAGANSLRGLAYAFGGERAFLQEVIFCLILLPVVFFLPVGGVEKAVLVGSMVLVLIVELLNSAIEGACDYISLERDIRAKRIKDMASGAVFLSLMGSLGAWLWVLSGIWW